MIAAFDPMAETRTGIAFQKSADGDFSAISPKSCLRDNIKPIYKSVVMYGKIPSCDVISLKNIVLWSGKNYA